MLIRFADDTELWGGANLLDGRTEIQKLFLPGVLSWNPADGIWQECMWCPACGSGISVTQMQDWVTYLGSNSFFHLFIPSIITYQTSVLLQAPCQVLGIREEHPGWWWRIEDSWQTHQIEQCLLFELVKKSQCSCVYVHRCMYVHTQTHAHMWAGLKMNRLRQPVSPPEDCSQNPSGISDLVCWSARLLPSTV